MTPWRPPGTLLLALALALLCWGVFVWWPIVADDSYITYRYAENLAKGVGPVFNVGERVEGYSNPLWMALLAGAIALGLDPILSSKILGVSAAVALLILLYRASRRTGVAAWGAGVATIFVGASTPLQVWSVGGLETILYALLFFAGLERLARGTECDQTRSNDALIASALLAGAALTRPEGIAFWAGGLAIVSWRERRDAFPYCLPGVALLLHVGWRYSYYGDLLPNTFYVKAGAGPVMWAAGLDELWSFLLNPAQAALCLLGLAGALVSRSLAGRVSATWIFASASAFHIAYVLSVGGDALGWARFYVPVLAPLAFLLSGLVHETLPAGRRQRVLQLAVAMGAAVAVGQAVALLAFASLPGLNLESQIYREGMERLGRHLRETRPPDTLIAVTAAGAIPYFSGLPTVDMLGLSDRHIARVPFAEAEWTAGHMKWDHAYVLSRRPDLIVLNMGYFRAGDLAGRVAERGLEFLDPDPQPLNRDLYAALREDGSYEYKAIPFPDGARYFVFERKPESDGSLR